MLTIEARGRGGGGKVGGKGGGNSEVIFSYENALISAGIFIGIMGLYWWFKYGRKECRKRVFVENYLAVATAILNNQNIKR